MFSVDGRLLVGSRQTAEAAALPKLFCEQQPECDDGDGHQRHQRQRADPDFARDQVVEGESQDGEH